MSLEATFAVMALVALFLVFLVKLFNVMNKGELYKARVVLIGFMVAWICWLVLFMSLSAALMGEETIETPEAETYTISTNSYGAYSLYLSVGNMFVAIASVLTALEIMFLFNGFKSTKKPLKARGAKNAWW